MTSKPHSKHTPLTHQVVGDLLGLVALTVELEGHGGVFARLQLALHHLAVLLTLDVQDAQLGERLLALLALCLLPLLTLGLVRQTTSLNVTGNKKVLS